MFMRRHLTFGDRTARHPFLAMLPSHVRERTVSDSPSSGRGALALTRDDVRGFANAYVACLVAVAAFIF
jgi:hypothetical protein